MSNLPKFLEDSQYEIERRVLALESEILEGYIDEYLAEFDTDNEGNLTQSTSNYMLANRSETIFNDIYDGLIVGFLIWLGNKLKESAHLSISHFHDIGVKASYKEVSFIEKQIGLKGTKQILRGSYLYNLGKMVDVRQTLQNYILQALSQGQKLNLMLRGARPIFKSTSDAPSTLNKFYRKYAYDSVSHMLNTVSKWIADARGLDKFLYEGGLVKDSRDFCIERAGKVYTREDGESWNNFDWRGKIHDLDFFIQVGGYNCMHSITWLKE